MLGDSLSHSVSSDHLDPGTQEFYIMSKSKVSGFSFSRARKHIIEDVQYVSVTGTPNREQGSRCSGKNGFRSLSALLSEKCIVLYCIDSGYINRLGLFGLLWGESPPGKPVVDLGITSKQVVVVRDLFVCTVST
jgi:hypothetical protein